MSVDRSLLNEWERRRAISQKQGDPLRSGGGDGTSGGVSEDWKASVDRHLGQLHGDVRALLNRGVIAVVALAGMIAGLYFYTNDKVDGINARLTAIEVQQAKADGKLDLILERTSRAVDGGKKP